MTLSISARVFAISVGLAALQAGEHGRGHIELDGDLVVRQRRGDLVDLALERVVVDRIERLMQIVLQEQPDHRMRRHQVDLEAQSFGTIAFALERGKFRVRRLGDIGIKQIVEAHVIYALARHAAGSGCARCRWRARGTARRIFQAPDFRQNAGSSQVIQSDRSPVSPSGMRLRRGPSTPLTVANTSRASRSGTLPTR